MNNSRYILVALFALASAFAQSVTSPPVEHRGHLLELSGLPIQNLDGCWLQSFEVTDKQVYWAIYCPEKKTGLISRYGRSDGTLATLTNSSVEGNVLGFTGLRLTPKGVSFVAKCPTNTATSCSAWLWESSLQKTADANAVIEVITSGDRRTTKAKLLQISPDYYGTDGKVFNNLLYQLTDTLAQRMVIIEKNNPSVELLIQSSRDDQGLNVSREYLVFKDGFGVKALQRSNNSPKTLFGNGGTIDGFNSTALTFGYDRSTNESLGSIIGTVPNVRGRLVRFDPDKGVIVLTGNENGTLIAVKGDNGRIVFRSLDTTFVWNGQDQSKVIVAGDELFGKKITQTGQATPMDFAAVQGCDVHIVDVANSRSIVAHDPCVTSATRNKDGSVTIRGDNFSFPGFNPRILADDGVVVIPDSVSKTEIVFTPTGLFGSRKIRVAMGSSVLSNSVNMTFDAVPSPTIVSFSCSATLVTSGDEVSCSWETIGGSATINGETVDARGSRTFTVRNFLALTLTVTGTDGTISSSLQDLRVLPMFLSGIECDFSVSPSPCKFSGVGFTGQSSVRLVAINADGVEEEIGIFPVNLDATLENVTFEVPQTLGPGSYKLFGQTPGEGIGGMQTLETDIALEVTIPEPAPPDPGNNSKKEVR